MGLMISWLEATGIGIITIVLVTLLLAVVRYFRVSVISSIDTESRAKGFAEWRWVATLCVAITLGRTVYMLVYPGFYRQSSAGFTLAVVALTPLMVILLSLVGHTIFRLIGSRVGGKWFGAVTGLVMSVGWFGHLK